MHVLVGPQCKDRKNLMSAAASYLQLQQVVNGEVLSEEIASALRTATDNKTANSLLDRLRHDHNDVVPLLTVSKESAAALW